MTILDFSVSGWHGFSSITQVCFRISVLNFMCMSFVAVGRSLMIVSYVAFKMAALWFWTMFNCNPPIAHCHPLLWGGGILVDHWSTISSCYWISKSFSILKVECWHLCQPNSSFSQVELTTWLFSFKYQYTRKFLYQSKKLIFGQPARKLSVDPWAFIHIGRYDIK